MADGADVRIRPLGGFEVTVGDRPVAAGTWRLRKAKTLVKLLALVEGPWSLWTMRMPARPRRPAMVV